MSLRKDWQYFGILPNRKSVKKQLSVTLLIFWFGTSSVVSAALPPAFEAIYRVRKAGMTLGEVTVTLNYEKGHFRYEKRTITKGLLSLFRKDVITEKSLGVIHGDEIRLTDYDYHLDRGKKSRRTSIRIYGNKAIGQYRNQDYELSIPEGTLDRASIELALIRDAMESPSTLLSYSVIDKAELKTYQFKPTKSRRVKVPAGKFKCQEYRRERATDKRSTSLCLARKADYLPVYATHTENGTAFFVELVRYRHL